MWVTGSWLKPLPVKGLVLANLGVHERSVRFVLTSATPNLALRLFLYLRTSLFMCMVMYGRRYLDQKLLQALQRRGAGDGGGDGSRISFWTEGLKNGEVTVIERLVTL